jgi:hypothetical protein
MQNLITTGSKRLVIAGDDEIAWASRKLDDVKWPDDTKAMAIYEGTRICATILYNHFTEHSCCIHIATDGKKNWATRGMLYGIFALPFLQCGHRCITAPIAERNIDAQILVLKLGFKFEGRRLHALGDDNELLFGMSREGCFWIGDKG